MLLLYDEEPAYSQRPSGLVLPGTVAASKKYERTATIIAVGSEVTLVKSGDRVLINKAYGLEVPHEDMGVCRLVRVSEDQIEAVLTGDAEREDYAFEIDGLSL